MKVALGQFVVKREWQENAQACINMMAQAREASADLLVLPEAVLATDMTNPDWIREAAQPLNGPFLTQLLTASQGQTLTTVFGMHVPGDSHKVFNVLVVIRDGKILAEYRKLHLYDAFSMQESARVEAGQDVPPLVPVAGMNVGLMTCYDVRFPEMARRLVLDGADVLVVPSAWVRGPLKEMHWDLLTRTRALENTCYVLAVGECGARNIGNSMVIDPLGVPISRAAESPALIVADLDPQRIAAARALLPVLENRRFARPELDPAR
ncbi:deaminated glutathione amidase [Pantoea stewartii]|uniref:Hydrolase n=1 Tax=Pantoea stewartii subsp. stewartii DC283 TaxID=660596 RepID=H3RAJ1_PANSE|nr:deaminated glutathione amidase [Pantoea stewartii]ARF49282.1 hydrolase [Pantoea stewartii subsp. stewartii DC283]EHU01589.1 putative hydrolase [Pantoea stewartii subsp. stewartii DC283]KAB0553371.1 deaminated glutathione amidase [Pantoea stewartii subsp. stewartii]